MNQLPVSFQTGPAAHEFDSTMLFVSVHEHQEHRIISNPAVELYRRRPRQKTGKRENTAPTVGKAEKRYQCEQCGKEFKQKCNFERHELVHTKARPFKCPKCPRTYPDKSYLKDHLRIHVGDKRFFCTLCGWGTVRKCNLNRHMIGHEAARNVLCPTCGKAYKSRDSLKRHSKIHHDERHICHLCDTTTVYKSRKSLRRHQRVRHPDFTPLSCYICRKSFDFNNTYAEHMTTHQQPS